MKNILGATLTSLLLCLSLASYASDESWTREMRTEFRQGCAYELERVGMTSSSAWTRCDCMTDKVEEEFGLAEFGYFISSEERNDAEIMERTDRAIAPCFE